MTRRSAWLAARDAVEALADGDDSVIRTDRTRTGWGAYCPAVPGCVAAADTRDEAERLMTEALSLHEESLRSEHLASGELRIYELRDGGGGSEEIEAESMEDALGQSEAWVREGDWTGSEDRKTIWVTAYVHDIAADEQDSVKVQIDPAEPDCTGDEHDWEATQDLVGGIESNPGVWGHGGGVTIQEVCVRCGLGKCTDTWAQDSSDGEQGLTSVEYEADKIDEDELVKYWRGKLDARSIEIAQIHEYRSDYCVVDGGGRIADLDADEPLPAYIEAVTTAYDDYRWTTDDELPRLRWDRQKCEWTATVNGLEGVGKTAQAAVDQLRGYYYVVGDPETETD